jgi:hypothetical protein
VDFFLDVDGDDGDGEVFLVLLVFASPDELRVERGVARVEHGLWRVLILGDEVAELLGGDVLALVAVADGFDGGERSLLRGLLFGHGVVVRSTEYRVRLAMVVAVGLELY